jgi:hypothetical protein
MNTFRTPLQRVCCSALLAALAGLAQAAEPAPAAAKASVFNAPAASDSLLASRRGGTSIVTQDVGLAGNVSDNRAVNVNSGSNAVAGGSFTNAVGLSTVIQNSGSNVLIQHATTVTVQLK